jgi:hypothetical protein
MIECKVLKPVVYRGEAHRPGQIVEFSDRDAKGLAADGVVELPNPVADPSASKSSKKKPAAKPTDPTPQPTDSPPAAAPLDDAPPAVG